MAGSPPGKELAGHPGERVRFNPKVYELYGDAARGECRARNGSFEMLCFMAGYDVGMKTIVTVADVEEAISQSRAVIFVAVDWATQSRDSEVAVRQILKANRVTGYRIDVTEQHGEVWHVFSAWLAKQGQDVSRIADCGSGPLLLSRSGRIVASVLYPAVQSNELLTLVGQASA